MTVPSMSNHATLTRLPLLAKVFSSPSLRTKSEPPTASRQLARQDPGVAPEDHPHALELLLEEPPACGFFWKNCAMPGCFIAPPASVFARFAADVDAEEEAAAGGSARFIPCPPIGVGLLAIALFIALSLS